MNALCEVKRNVTGIFVLKTSVIEENAKRTGFAQFSSKVIIGLIRIIQD